MDYFVKESLDLSKAEFVPVEIIKWSEMKNKAWNFTNNGESNLFILQFEDL